MDILNKFAENTCYKDMKMQPIQLIIGAKCDYIQGSIIKHISKYKLCNSKNDVLSAIRYAQIASELCSEDKHYNNIGLGFSFCRINELTTLETMIIVTTLQHDYKMVVRHCNQLLINWRSK